MVVLSNVEQFCHVFGSRVDNEPEVCVLPRHPMRLFLLQAALVSALQVHDAHEVAQCSSHPPGKHLIQLPEIQRQFLLVVPEEYAGSKTSGVPGVPLVLAFHGFSDSPWYLDLFMDFSKHISRYGWLGVLPFGLNQSKTNGLDGVDACCPQECLGECCRNTPKLRQKDDTACGWKDNEMDMRFVEAIYGGQLKTLALIPTRFLPPDSAMEPFLSTTWHAMPPTLFVALPQFLETHHRTIVRFPDQFHMSACAAAVMMKHFANIL